MAIEDNDMTAQDYIDSGMVMDYCLGLLEEEEKIAFELAMLMYPQLVQEVNAVQAGLDKYAAALGLEIGTMGINFISPVMKNLLLEREMNIETPPLINRFSDYKTWLSAVEPLLPKKFEGGLYAKVLKDNGRVSQLLVMTATDIPDEVHEDVMESFIILEGECECYIGNKVHRMGAGSFMEIPMHEHHDLKVISPYVVGIRQRVAV